MQLAARQLAADLKKGLRPLYVLHGDEAGTSGFSAAYVFENMEPVEYTGKVSLSDGSEQEITVTLMKNAQTGKFYLADPVRRAIGLVHAGWRGTLGRIPAVAIERMGEEFGTDPADLYAAIGPGICQDCYEMGDEVRDQFADQWGESAAAKLLRKYPAFAEDGTRIPGGKFHLDLMEANRMTLLLAGVREDRLAVSNVCTKCNADVFYSFRAHRMENEQAAMIVNRFGQ